MKEVFIVSSLQILKGKTAGSQRIFNIAKSLAMGNINVYLCSLKQITKGPIERFELYPNIYSLENIYKEQNSFNHLFNFIFSLNRFIKKRKSRSVIYLFPTYNVLNDLVFLVYFKLIKKHKFFCEINELRTTNLYSIATPVNIISKILFYVKFPILLILFKLNEILTLYYDGIVVISTSLEKYFSKYTKKMIRIPILCDLSKPINANLGISYNNETFKICFSGSIYHKKEGFDILFKALYKINLRKNVELYLYGNLSDDEKYALNHLESAYELQNKVFYKGFIEPGDLPQEFIKYHLLILPRPLSPQTRYGFSTKLAEYLVSGVPVLVTDVSDNAIYIKDNYNGFIISPGSSSGMAAKIIEIIENYNRNSRMIARNAYKTAQEIFDYKLYTHTFINFFYNETN